MLMLLFAVTTSWAAATDLPTLTTDENNPVWYLIKNVRTSKYATYEGDAATMTQQATATAASFFYFTGSITDGVATVKIHNYAAGDKLCASFNSWTDNGIDWYLNAQATGVSISNNTNYSGNNTSWNDAGGFGEKVEFWNGADPGSAWELVPVTDFSSIINVDAAKTTAKTNLENLKNITVLFTETTINDAIAQIDAVTPASNSINDLNTAVSQINTIANSVYSDVNNKNVRFTTYGRKTDTGGVDITAVAGGAAETNLSGDAGIWTLKSVDNGFKMYNFTSNLWMGAPTGTSQRVPTVATEDAAAIYVVNYNAENKVNLMNNGNTLHANGWGNIVQWNDNSSDASIFLVAAEPEITITRDEYTEYLNAFTTANNSISILQKTNGVVTSGEQFYCNNPESGEGSYAGLIDENTNTYFHSSWSNTGTEPHYLRVDLGTDVTLQNIRFYTMKRNDNARPTSITIFGSNNDSDYTEVTTIDEGLVAANDYISEKIDLGAEYRYIKFLVNSTNNNVGYFTYAEFYVYDASDETQNNYLNNIRALKTASITDANILENVESVTTDHENIAFAYYKQEALDATAEYEEYVAEEDATPTVGQFTYASFIALQSAINDATTAAEIEEALNTFLASRNSPVFIIKNNYTDGYSDGKYIFYNGSDWRWGDLNKYSTQFMMEVPGATTSNIADIAVDAFDTNNTYYPIKDMATETVIRDLPAQIVKIADWDNVYNLQYNAGANNTNAAHHAQAGGALVNWKPATTTDNKASAWSFEYVSDAYTIKEYTAQLNAAAALQTAYNANISYKTAEFSDALGEYSYTGNISIADAFAQAEEILNASYSELFATEVSAIEAATNDITAIAASISINLPKAGSYIRIKAVEGWNDDAPYMTSVNSESKTARAAFVADADASTIFYFDGNCLVSYASGNYLVDNNDSGTFLGYNGVQESGSKIAFSAASNNLTGAYNITFNNGNRWLFVNNNDYTDAANSTDTRNGYCFNLEEVTTLPVTITDAGYATFYAPVEVSFNGIKAYYTTGETEEDKYIQMVELENVIPANEGAILEGAEGTYDLTINYEGTTTITDNKLQGTVARSLITKVGGAFYVLGKNAKGNVGLYNPINDENEEEFYNAGHKAYMFIPASTQTIGYSFGFDWSGTTGIDNIEEATEESATEAIYDITGRKIKAITTPGLYIIGGKKVVVK